MGYKSYEEAYRLSLKNPEKFWGEKLGDLSTIEDGTSIDEVSTAIELMKEELSKE